MLQLLRIIRDELASDLSSPGSFYIYAIAVIAFLISGDYNFATKLLLAAAAVSAATYTIKVFYYKQRPDNPKKVKFKDIFVKLNESSFPSLHCARAAILGIAFLSKYQTIFAAVFAILVIVTVGISRIKLKRHYLSDVIGGILLGVFTGYLVFLA